MIPFCEHPELSLAKFGAPYNSLRVPDHVQPIQSETLHQILDAVSLSYNLDDDAVGESWGRDSNTAKTLRNMRRYQVESTDKLFPMDEIEDWAEVVPKGGTSSEEENPWAIPLKGVW